MLPPAAWQRAPPGVSGWSEHARPTGSGTAGVCRTVTDAWRWDAPFVYNVRKYAATHDASPIREGHKAGRDIGYCHIEKLHDFP